MQKETIVIKKPLCVYCHKPVWDNKFVINKVGVKRFYHDTCPEFNLLELKMSETVYDSGDETIIVTYELETPIIKERKQHKYKINTCHAYC